MATLEGTRTIPFFEPPSRSYNLRENLSYASQFAQEEGDSFCNRHIVSTCCAFKAWVISIFDAIGYVFQTAYRATIAILKGDGEELVTVLKFGFLDTGNSLKLTLFLPWMIFAGFFAPDQIYPKMDFGLGDTLESRYKALRVQEHSQRLQRETLAKNLRISRENERTLSEQLSAMERRFQALRV